MPQTINTNTTLSQVQIAAQKAKIVATQRDAALTSTFETFKEDAEEMLGSASVDKRHEARDG